MYLPPEVALHPGQVLGEKYVLDRLIGKGGMGVVWAGTNKHTGKRVALKFIRRSFGSNSEAAELFRREALAASRVNHPNVVSVFDVVDHEGMACIVMELLDGEPLNKYLEGKGPLSMEEAAALLLPAMRGVAAANAQGVIHRDLKPHNIFVCKGPDGRLVTTKVLDFGSAVMMEGALGSSVATGQLATPGTPAYMSPEHIAGASHIDERADVYGFGVVLFELLAGQHPFPGAPGQSLLMRILHELPPALASLRPDLSSEVVKIVECAMAKEPSERFPNLDPFILLVEAHLLPSSALPRNMTPLAGVPVFPLRESNSDATVQATRREESSDLHETRALYSLPGASTTGAGETPLRRIAFNRTEEKTPAIKTSLDELPTLGRSFRRFFAKRVVVGVIFGAILTLVIWLAFPMPGRKSPPSGPGSRFAPPENTARAPEVAPVKAAQPAPEPSAPARPDESLTEGLLPDEFGLGSGVPTRAGMPMAKAVQVPRHVSVVAGSARAANRSSHGRAGGAHASNSAASISPAGPAQSQPAAAGALPPAQEAALAQPSTSSQSSSPIQPPPANLRPAARAGALSPDDF